MQNKEQVFQYMKDEIEHLAKGKEDKILQEAKEIEEEAYRQIEEEAKRDATKQMEKELAKITLEASLQGSKANECYTKRLVEKRNEYVDTVFQEAKQQLIAFTNTKQYQEYLVEHVKRLQETYVIQEATLYLRKEDMQYQRVIQQAYNQPIDIKEIDTIEIGGIILEQKEQGIYLDDTLDIALENQMEWLLESSGLMIK